MSKHIHIPEEILVEIWKNQSFDKELFTESGEKIEVQYTGEENKEVGGPDFINARIKIGNLTYLGDVEIDNTHADWKNHGHNLNRRFNKVILHAIIGNDSNYKLVYTHDGRKVPTFCMAPYIDDRLIDDLKKKIVMEEGNKTNKVYCFKVSSFADEKAKIELLTELGFGRFKKKCERLIHRYRELLFISNNTISEPVMQYQFPEEVYQSPLEHSDLSKKHIWEQLFYEEMFEALGYSQNKNILLSLAQAVPLDSIREMNIPKKEFVTVLEAIYFKISGLVPGIDKLRDDATLAYVRSVEEIWQKYKIGYTGHHFNPVQWHFSRLRPQNFPTLRIAAGTRIAHSLLNGDLIPSLIKKITEIHTLSVLKNSVISLLVMKADGYWARHYSFGKQATEDLKYFLGKSRAEEALVNVVLPFMYIYFDLFGRKKVAQKVINLYSDISCDSDNGLVHEVAQALQLGKAWRKTVIAQGMIELFRQYCSKEKCDDCPIGKVVFSEEET